MDNDTHMCCKTSIYLEQANQVCTFSENAGLRLATNEPEQFINYNKRFLSRITPGTWRVDSSNLNSQDFWNVGCQMGSLIVLFFDVSYQLMFVFNKLRLHINDRFVNAHTFCHQLK
jgi:hypothetical protein